jgi:hypothetical protein
MDIISYLHKSVEVFFQILELVEVWTCRSMELSPSVQAVCLFVVYVHVHRNGHRQGHGHIFLSNIARNVRLISEIMSD